MFVTEEFRKKNVGTSILNELEKWARQLGNESLVLQMGNEQPEAKILYKKQGFTIIANYGQYIEMGEESICMKKDLGQKSNNAANH